MANDTKTPHGTFSLRVMGKDTAKKNLGQDLLYDLPDARWAAPIAADCRYWDGDWSMNVNQSLPRVVISEDQPIVVNTPDGPASPTKQTAYLVGTTVDVARRSLAGREMIMADYFGVLPLRNSLASLDAFAKEGAMVLHNHLRSDASVGPFLALQRVTMALLLADDTHNKRWKRAVPFVNAPADADHVFERLAKHLVDQTHDSDKRRVEVFATHAMISGLTQHAVRRGQTGQVDGRLAEHMWTRIEAEDKW
ncbi:hypothetical protein LTR08_001799 [Meristemomyces frigidus]|nr:hypothetical protein LTR08_001799 [Meristemomyces frigidus]